MLSVGGVTSSEIGDQCRKAEKRTREAVSWPKSERPRERLYQLGASSLSIAELLSILIGTGTRSLHVSYLAARVAALPSEEIGWASLHNIAGLGSTKVARILAALEWGRRMGHVDRDSVARIREASDVVDFLGPRLAMATREIFISLSVDVKNRVLGVTEVAIGTVDGVMFHPRDVFRDAVRAGASGVICVHNHPSGDPTPSPEDQILTKRLREGAELLGLRFLDHVIVTGSGYHSFAGSRNRSRKGRD